MFFEESIWGNWVHGQCSVTCGNGSKVISRKCLQGKCQGNFTKIDECSINPCLGLYKFIHAHKSFLI